MIQQGQVFKLTAKGADGEPLCAYRYRLEGRGSARPQVGGFASRAEAQKALAQLGPTGRAATITLAELVGEFRELHQAEKVTIAKRARGTEFLNTPRSWRRLLCQAGLVP